MGDRAFEFKIRSERDYDLLRVRLNSDWAAAHGPLSGIILHLRDRTEKAVFRSTLVFWMLVVTVLFGVGFYLGLPFYQSYFDGRKPALQANLAELSKKATRIR